MSPEPMTCPKGHRWQPDPATTLPSACPVCGAAGQNAALLALCDTISPAPSSADFADPTTAAVEWHTGARLGDYELLEEISQSGLAHIHKARRVNTKHLVALKIIAFREAGSESFERFRKEAEVAERLRHPNVVQIYEVGQHENQTFLAMEFCTGGTLIDKLRNGPLSPTKAAETVQTLAQAVHAVHQQGILHRDLKPGNVLLTAEGQLKITDFGLANTFDEVALTQTGTILGTPAYMAPELATGKHHLTGPGTDIYSLGVILYECLTGQLPFEAHDPWEMIQRVINSEPIPPSRLRPEIPRDLEAICLKCLQKEPRQRYTTAADLAEDLGRFLLSETLRARRSSWASLWRGGLRGWVRRLWPPAASKPDLLAAASADNRRGPTVTTGLTVEKCLSTVEHDLLTAALADISDAVFLFSRLDKLVLVNRSARQLLGIPDDSPVGTTDLPAELITIQAGVRHGESVNDLEIFLRPPRRPDGVWVSLGGRALPGTAVPGSVLLTARDQSERRALRASESLYHSLVDTLPMCVFRKDVEGRYTYANALFCDTVGKPLAEVLGQTDFAIFTAELAEKYRQADLRLMQTRRGVEEIEEHQSSACAPHCRCGRRRIAGGLQDGEADKTYLQVLLTPLFDSDGQTVGTQGAFWDVTQRLAAEQRLRQLAANLERANAELARSNTDLEQFAYVASHDLQEPLRMVTSFIQLLQRRYQGRLAPDADEWIAFAVGGVERMQGLINDLLALSRVGSRVEPRREIDSERAFEQAVANLQTAIQESDAVVRSKSLPVVCADATQVVQLFQNLIGNALKFRRTTRPIVRVSAHRRGGEWQFRVEDNGIGIEERHQGRIFDLCQRLHSRERYSGNGVGLAICKRIVARHGGRIWVESRLGQGSSFFFTLPAGRKTVGDKTAAGDASLASELV